MRRAGPHGPARRYMSADRRLRPAGVDGGSVGDLNAHRSRQQALRAHRINRPDLVEVRADGAWPIGEPGVATDAGDQPAVAEQLVLGATKVVDGYRVPLQLYVAIRQRLGAQALWRGWDVDEGRRGPAAQLLATPLCTGERQVAGHGPLESRRPTARFGVDQVARTGRPYGVEVARVAAYPAVEGVRYGSRRAEYLVDGLVGGHQQLQRLVEGLHRVGEDGAGTRVQVRRGHVVDALPGDVPGRARHARLALAGRVAEMAQEHDRVGRQSPRLADRLAAVVVDVSPGRALIRVQADAVLILLAERRVGTWPAVAVAQVHHEVGALDVGQDVGPRRPRMEDSAHVHAVALGEPRQSFAIVEVLVGHLASR